MNTTKRKTLADVMRAKKPTLSAVDRYVAGLAKKLADKAKANAKPAAPKPPERLKALAARLDSNGKLVLWSLAQHKEDTRARREQAARGWAEGLEQHARDKAEYQRRLEEVRAAQAAHQAWQEGAAARHGFEIRRLRDRAEEAGGAERYGVSSRELVNLAASDAARVGLKRKK